MRYEEHDENLIWEEVSVEHIIEDQWIDFRRSCYRFPDGTTFEPYYSYSRRDYVVIAATDTEGNHICVRQFRQGIGKVTTEYVAGGIERTDGTEYGKDGASAEDSLAAAKRELLEESGYESDEWTKLLVIPSNPTIADNYAHIYMARNCRKVSEQHLDDTEYLNVRLYTEEELKELISDGNFLQPIHVLAYELAKKEL
ncbi:MAG TPA: NUDIX hydrolase [Eubacterium sp.]|nr:NUDIX hydrolase [Eubacterium sp.]